MPIRFFWTMYENIDRIQAVADTRALDIQYTATATGMAGGEGVKRLRETLVMQIGNPVTVKIDPMAAKLDRRGVNDLKSMLRQKQRK